MGKRTASMVAKHLDDNHLTFCTASSMTSSTILPLAFSALAAVALASIAPNTCSPTFCGTFGSHATCHTPAGKTTCAKYAFTPAAFRSCVLLSKSCPNSCYFIPVYGSDGKPYCTPCHLHAYSCRVGFKVFGPVGNGVLERDQEHVDAEERVRVAPKVAVKSSKAILPIPPPCSARLCTAKGSSTACTFGWKKTTCGKYSFTEESKKQCDIQCIQICYEDGPIASNGRKYCSFCHLRQASCASHYKIFGPVTHPSVRSSTTPSTKTMLRPTGRILDLCSKDNCTAKGANALCVDAVHKIFSSCAKWAKTPQKKKQCSFVCLALCVPPSHQPKDNNGKSYCSLCYLQAASCAADFKIFGPVKTDF